MVVVDPGSPREIWTLTLPASGAPSWVRVPVEGSDFPSTRTLASAVLDPGRDRVLVFGGSRGHGGSNEVWALSLGDAPRWTLLVPEGTAPGPRVQAAAIYDPVRDRMIVHGGAWSPGYVDEILYDDMWSLELAGTPRWVELSPLGTLPAKRKGASAVYDPLGDRMLEFGGWTRVPIPWLPGATTGAKLDETWALSLTDPPVWSRIAVSSAPPGREETVMVVDTRRQQVVVSGGSTYLNPAVVNDTWALPLDAGRSAAPAAWVRVPTPAGSPAVSQHAAIYSPERDRLVQFGGQGPGNLCFELDLAGATWLRIDSHVAGPFPSRRVQPTLVAEPASSRLLLFGGGWGCQHDLWEFPLHGPAAWDLLPTSGIAPACRDPNFVADPVRRRLLCITGESIRGHGMLDQVWAMSFDEPRVWTRLETRGPNPPPRFEYGLVYDSSRDRVLLFGGSAWWNRAQDWAIDLDDVWQLTLDDLTWLQLVPENSPGGRRRASAHYDPIADRLVIVGGATSVYRGWTSRSDCWALPLGGSGLSWSRFAPDLPPGTGGYVSSPQHIALDPVRNRFVHWDGAWTAWTLALDSPGAWSALDLSGEPPTARQYFGLGYDPRGDQMLVFGGWDGSQKGDLWALRFSDEVTVVLRGLPPDGRSLPRHGVVHAAILGREGFSVDSILVETVSLGGAAVFDPGRRGDRGERRDLDGDGLRDLILPFQAESLRVTPGDSLLRLWGRTPHFAVRGVAEPEHARLRRPAARPLTGASNGVLGLTIVNPSRSALEVRFWLPDASPARLEVHDVAGRRMAAHEVPGSMLGRPVIEFRTDPLPPGLYLVRLRQGGRQLVARGVVIP